MTLNHGLNPGLNHGLNLPDADQFALRVIQDAMSEATAKYWLHRAQQLEDAVRPRPDDFYGNATNDDILARHVRVAQQIQACRSRASLCELNILSAWEVVLAENLITRKAA